jgi:hypothetical protein
MNNTVEFVERKMRQFAIFLEFVKGSVGQDQ